LLQAGAQIDACAFWEDTCYNGGHLLRRATLKKFVASHYRRTCDLLDRYNLDIHWLDCNGNIEKLIPLWMKSVIQYMMPVEMAYGAANR
jgi:hypothetical protein